MNPFVENLKQQGFKLNHEGGGNYRLHGFGGLIIKNNYWYQHSTKEKGHTQQLLQKLKVYKNISSALDFQKKSLILKKDSLEYSLRKQGFDIIDYLFRQRMIDLNLLNTLTQAKLIGQEEHYICFYGYDQKGTIKCISKRAFNHTQHLKKIEHKGSDKHNSFSIPSQPYSKTIILCESPIDALSIACMENHLYHKGYFQTHKIALCGNYPGKTTSRIKKLRPEKIFLAFDNDSTGQQITKDIYDQIHHIAPTKIISYSYGKDPNDWWIYRKKII